MKVLLDTSVLLDLLLNRSPWAADMATVWNAHRRGQIEAFLAAFTVPTVFYIVRRQTDLATARTAVADCLATLHIAPVDQTPCWRPRRCQVPTLKTTSRSPVPSTPGWTSSSPVTLGASPTLPCPFPPPPIWWHGFQDHRRHD
jgi:hypothetical protein